MEELIGHTTSVGVATRESGAIVGNSLKTIYSRLTTMQPSIDALSNIGIAVKDSNGEMKSATTIINDLASRWGSLSAETQQNTAVTLAGRFQLSRFLALMNNHKMAISATESALHSEGSAMQENAKHIKSLSSRIERMKSSWEELALVMGNAVITDSLVGLLNIATLLGRGFASLSSTVGVLPVLLPTITLSVFALSVAFRQLIVSTALTVAGIFGIAPAAIAATGGVNLLSGAVTGLKFSLRGLLASTGIGLVAVGIGFGLETLINTLGNTKDRVEELSESYSDANQKVYDANRIRELSSQYDKLTKSTSLTNDEKVKLSKVESELSTKYGIVLKSINEQTDAYVINSKAISQRIGLLQEEVKIEREKAKLNYESQKTAIEASISAKRKEKKEAEDAYNEANKRYEDFLNNKKTGKVMSNKDNYYSEVLPFQAVIDPKNKEQADIIQGLGEELAKKVKDAKNLWNASTDEFQKSINSKTAYTNSQLQNYADTLEVSGVKITAKTRVLLDSFSSVAAMDGIEISDDKIKSVVEFFQNTKITSIDEAVAALSTRLPAGVKLSGDAIKSLENNLNKLDFGKYGNGIDETSESFGEMGSNVGALSTKMEAAAQILKPLNQALHDINNGQSLSSDAITDLIIQYPQLTSAIRMTADGYTIEKDALNEVRLAKVKKAQSDLIAERDSTKITLSNSISRVTAYGIELGNINTLAQAKSKIANIDFNKFQETANPKSGLADTLGIATTIGNSFIDNKKKQEDAAVEGLRSAILVAEKTSNDQLKLLSEMLNNPKFGIGEETRKKEKQDTQATLQTLQDFTKEQIENINSVVAAREENIKSLEKQIQIANKAEDYNKSIELTSQLLAVQKGKIDDITTANKRLAESADKIRNEDAYSKLAEQFGSLNGDKMVGFDQWFNDGANASDTYTESLNKIRQEIIDIMGDGKNLTTEQQNTVKELENQEKLYSTIFSQIQSFKKAHADNNSEITKTNDIMDGITENQKDLIEQRRKSQFENSEKWIADEVKRMELAKKSEIEIAQVVLKARLRMADEAWTREKEITELSENEQILANTNVAEAEKVLRDKEFANSEAWISAEVSRREMAGQDEITIAEMVLSARKRMADELWTKERGLEKLSEAEQLAADRRVYDARIALQNLQQAKLKKQIEDQFDTIVNSASDAIDKTITNLKKSLDAKELFDMDELNNSITEITTALDILDGITSDYASNVFNTDSTKAKLTAYKSDITSIVSLMNNMTNSTSENASTLKSYIETQTAYAQSLKDKISDVNNLIKNTSDLYKREEESLANQIKAQEKLNDTKIDGFKKSLDIAEVFDSNNLANSINTITNALDVLDEKFSSAVSKDSTNQARSELATYRKEIDAVSESLLNFQKNGINDETFKSGSAESSITSEIKFVTDLKTRIDNLNQSIETTTLRYQQEEDAIAQLIKTTEDSADKEIAALNEKLKLLDEQVEVEDRLKKIQDINSELEKAKNDKRYEYIDENGKKILTFNKSQVSELEKQRDEILTQYERDDVKKALQDDIDRIEKNKTNTVKQLQEKLDKTKNINQQDLAAQKLYSSSLNELYGIILSNTNAKIEQFKVIQDTGIATMQTQLDKTKAIHQAELDALNLYQAQLSNVYGLIVQDTQNKIDELKAIYDKDLENMKSNFSKLVEAAMNGAISFNSILDIWKNSSISTLVDFGSQTAVQIANIKSKIDELNGMKINPIVVPEIVVTKPSGSLVPNGAGSTYNSGTGSSGGSSSGGSSSSGTGATFYTGGGAGSPSYYNGGVPVYLHDGGTVGGEQLKPNERPAILELGEEVVTRFNMDKLKDIILKPIDFMNQLTSQFKAMTIKTPDFSAMVNRNGQTPQSSDTHYHLSDFTIKANSPMEMFQGINHLVNSQKK